MACRMDLYSRARELDIQTEFVDGRGHRQVTDAAALKIILNALPERVPYRLVGGTVWVRSGRPSQSESREPVAFPVRWRIMSGSKLIAQGEVHNRTILWPAE